MTDDTEKKAKISSVAKAFGAGLFPEDKKPEAKAEPEPYVYDDTYGGYRPVKQPTYPRTKPWQRPLDDDDYLDRFDDDRHSRFDDTPRYPASSSSRYGWDEKKQRYVKKELVAEPAQGGLSATQMADINRLLDVAASTDREQCALVVWTVFTKLVDHVGLYLRSQDMIATKKQVMDAIRNAVDK